jgi:hypothetical protein
LKNAVLFGGIFARNIKSIIGHCVKCIENNFEKFDAFLPKKINGLKIEYFNGGKLFYLLSWNKIICF